ncbi:MAG: 3-phosphoshikimate 1-carboxyvinyltransferase, partial [Gemmatimonadota bacterium]|nr:3-phosphoshikimate 1-carboxyvinyltransferase [Gemmatimonadota bacterium]
AGARPHVARRERSVMRAAGIADVPGDKSLSHRALIVGALADGRSRVRGLLESDDVRSTASVLRALGADIEQADGGVTIAGRGLRRLHPPSRDLDCGNSGTTARLIAGVVAGHPFAARFVGDASLSRRPMKRIKQPLETMGATVDLERGDGLPMTVRGADLKPVVWQTSTASAQTKSAILLGALVAGVRAEVCEPAPSRDHTERLLAALGAKVEAGERRVVLEPVERLSPLDFDVPGDPSSAAFLAALALVANEGEVVLRDVGLNERRIGFFHVARRIGADIQWETDREVAGEPVGTIRARPSAFRGTAVEAAEIPGMIDELVLLGCLATRADGETIVRGAQELRVKESDRIATVVHNLRSIGADADETPDGFIVRGSMRPLRGTVRTRGDHRVAMAFGVLARIPGNDVRVDDASCVAVSYPRFWEDVERLTR